MECAFHSNFFLLPLFFGITFVLLSSRYYLVLLLYATALLLTALSWVRLCLLESAIYATVGLLAGTMVKYASHTTRILPKNLLKHQHDLFIYALELMLVPVLFFYIDKTAEFTNFPSGLLISFVGYTGWFIVVYNVNFRHEGMLRQSEYDVLFYNQTYLCWYVSMLPFYIAALVPLSTPVQCILGLLGLGALLLAERLLVPPLDLRSHVH